MSKLWRSKSEISAFIGLGTEFEGKLTFEGVIRMDGRFSGEIQSGGTLIVGETAHLTAEIDVDTVVVSGEVHGNLRAKTRAQFHAPAKIYGNIIAPVVIIDEGVVFEGACHMTDAAGHRFEEQMKRKVTLITREGQSQVESEII